MMSEKQSKQELRNAMMESLLQSAYQSDATEIEARIESVMDRIEFDQQTTVTVSATEAMRRGPRRGPRRWKRWMSLTVAALVLIALTIFLQLTGSTGSAMAAITRSIEAAQEFVVRHYRVTVTTRKSDQSSEEFASDLYVQGSDRFALRHPALLRGGSFWLGTDGQEAWIVPAIGPVRVGDETGLGQWLSQREQLSTPFLHVETILARMKLGYRLEKKADMAIGLADGTSITCEHILGELQTNHNEKAPDSIELWSDASSGVAIRLIATWDAPAGKLGHEKIMIEFVDEPTLAENWFTPDAHHSGNRRTLRFDSD